MLRTFNCGIGLIAVTDMRSSGHVIDAFQESGDKAMRIGTLVKRRRRSEGRTIAGR